MPTTQPRHTAEVIGLLHEIAQRLGLEGDNLFRARAYRTAAESLSAVTKPLGEVIAARELTSIPGIGSSIAGTIEQLYNTGSAPQLEKLRQEIPEGVIDMLAIPGMRTNQLLKLYQETGIASVEALQQALKNGQLKDKKGVTPAFLEKLQQGLKIRREAQQKQHLHSAVAVLEAAKRNLRHSHPHLRQVTIAGDVRRMCEVVEDFSVIAISDDPHATTPVLGDIRLYLCGADTFGSTLLIHTGSASHIESLAAYAKKKHLTLTADGLKKGRKVIASTTEEEMYHALGLPFIPPELREGEIEEATHHAGSRLVTVPDVQGILHAHTVRSDGANTLEEMAEATRTRGFHYLGITEHSQTASYAGGLKAAEVADQMKEADALNGTYGRRFHIFKGIESDILADGALDYPESVLKRFDFLIASIHSRFKLDRDRQTARIIRAVHHPATTILGHMTGRQLLRRPGYDVDIEAILSACAKCHVAVEINGHPWRLDMDWRLHQTALKLGCMVSINPDAHSVAEIDNVKWGVAMARKGGIPPERVLSCMTPEHFRKFIARKKRQAPR
jgi:DNA polymerase (family 10)